MIQFIPYQERSNNHIISQPRWLGNKTQIGVLQTNFDDGKMGYQVTRIQGKRNIVQNTYGSKVETVGVNYKPIKTSIWKPHPILLQQNILIHRLLPISSHKLYLSTFPKIW